jgi:hypothetical protein
MDNPLVHPMGLAVDIAGIRLRDYFAAAALQGYLVNGTNSASVTAEACYAYADAMLKERERKNG